MNKIFFNQNMKTDVVLTVVNGWLNHVFYVGSALNRTIPENFMMNTTVSNIDLGYGHPVEYDLEVNIPSGELVSSIAVGKPYGDLTPVINEPYGWEPEYVKIRIMDYIPE